MRYRYAQSTPLLIISLLFTFLPGTLQAQVPKYVELMQNPEANFSETQAAFDAYWEGRKVSKGSGWKPYQRWAHYMQSRLTPEGKQLGPVQTLQRYREYLEAHPPSANKRNSSTGDWTEVGPVTLPNNLTGQPNGMGRINCITFHPTDANTIYVGAPGGGIWRTTDYGSTWNSLNNGLTRLGVSSIVIHPTQPDTIFIGSGDRDAGDAPGYGVWWSEDGGDTWNPRNNGMGNRTVSEILMDPSNVNVMIATTTTGIYRTTDGGANWTAVLVGQNCTDIAFKPGDSNYIYAAGTKYYRSTNNGASFTQITSGVPTGLYRMALAVSANAASTVYLFAGDASGFNGLYRSTDNGATFTNQSTTPNICGYEVTGGAGNQAWYNHVALGDPTNANHIIIGGINIWESFDAGVTWSIVTHWWGDGGNPAVHADQHVLEYSPHTNELFSGNDGGIYYSADAGATWSDVSGGLGIAQIYKIGQSQTVRDLVLNGYQDNGTARYENGTFYTGIGGDGMECVIDYRDESVMYGALYYGDVRRSTDGGNSFSTIAANGVNGITEEGGWVAPYMLHPTNTDTMYIGYKNVWRSFNCRSGAVGSVSWTQISSFGVTDDIVDMVSAPSNGNIIYVSRKGTSNFYTSTNANSGTPTWTDLDANLPAGGTPKDIVVHPTNPSKLWISLGNNIYQSVDAGLNWTDFSGTLPNISANTIVFDKESSNEAMYIGMDVGIYYRDNSMSDWTLYATGLPNVEITELEIYYDSLCRGNDMLRASTYGRGLWESPLKDPGNVAPQACFFASEENVFCTGTSITLTDYSTHNPTSWTWTISPGTFTYTGGTNANSQNPEVEFTATGTYTITLSTSNAYGSDILVRTKYVNVQGTALSLPIAEDFESGALCGTASDCELTICTLPNNWINLTNGSGDDIDWRTNEGTTPSTGTGPAIDANPGTGIGNYIYTEASSCSGRLATMLSPCIDLGGATNPAISFNYFMEGVDMGSLHLDIYANGAWTENIMPAISGDQGAGWKSINLGLNPYAGEVVTFRLRGITGPNFTSDIALDNFSISGLLPIKVEQFEAQYLKQEVQLDWITRMEKEPGRFVVERSTDGQFFEVIGELPGKTATAEAQTYRFMDTQPIPGTSYYQLRMEDETGSIWYSDRVAVKAPFERYLWASQPYPDPFSEVAQFELTTNQNQKVRIEVLNTLGQPVQQIYQGDLEKGSRIFEIDGTKLAAGVYHLMIHSAEGSIHRQLWVR